jgi:hypothetical protein
VWDVGYVGYVGYVGLSDLNQVSGLSALVFYSPSDLSLEALALESFQV